MSKLKRKLILLLFLLLGVLKTHAQGNITAADQLADYDFLVTELKTYHQGLYQYVNKNTIDHQIDSIRNTIQAANKITFFKTVNALISLTNEGHSEAELPAFTQLKFGLAKSFIPIRIEFSDKKAIITKYYGKGNPDIEFGDQLLSINGISIDELMQKLKPYVVTDGLNETSFYQWVSWNLPLYFNLAYGRYKNFEIEVKPINSTQIKEVTIKATNALRLKNKKNTLNTVKRKNEFEYCQIEDHIGYLSIPNFYSYSNYEEFYKNSFTKIKKEGIKHLIIDVQQNVGGREGNENLLASYLFREEFQKYERVTVPLQVYESSKEDESVVENGWKLTSNLPSRGDFTLMSNYFARFDYREPVKDLIFEGKVYVLTSGVTFSGGAEFASMLRMTDRAIFIGEETGGAYEGNVSGSNRYIKLPNTKIKVKIPLIHYRIAVEPDLKGRGVLPEYEVPQSWRDIVEGKNSKLEFALNLIRKNEK